jgi:hypothetical protein
MALTEYRSIRARMRELLDAEGASIGPAARLRGKLVSPRPW